MDKPKEKTQLEKKSEFLPPYKKPYQDFKKVVQPGDTVKLETRAFLNKGEWILKTAVYVAKEVAVNCLIVREREAGIPWYAIHNWEIIKL